MSCVIYALVDPTEFSIRYVGLSRNGLTRAFEHSRPSRARNEFDKHNRRKAAWILGLLQRGLQPYVTVVEECATPEELPAREEHWISHFRSRGEPLTNLTNGGEGVAGYKFSDEERAYISQQTKLAMARPEVAARVKEANKKPRKRVDWHPDDELRALWSKQRKGRPCPMKGKRHRPESIEKMRAAKRGQPSGRKGETWSDETRAKIRLSVGKKIQDQHGTRYESVSEASRLTNISRHIIYSILSGKISEFNGYRFELCQCNR